MNVRFRTICALLLPILFLFSTGCDALSSDSSDESGVITLSGQVLNSETNNPIKNAFIRVFPYDLAFEATADGTYSFEVEIDSTMDLTVTASAEGYLNASLPVLALAGRTIEVPSFKLFQTAEEKATSGKASNIILLSQSQNSIGVRESGSVELSAMVFQLADSLGNPVVIDQSAEVHFRFGVQPGGGEFLSPAIGVTDNNGEITVNLSAGTKAGVVQIVAEATVDGRVIRSQPVAVSIHGGMPDQTHFSLGPVKRNFPGLNALGLSNPMNIIVGDKYSNPVRVGSSVYFDTSHGIVEGSTTTDDQGQGSVNLISANPLPPDGIAHVRAYTADDQQGVVSSVSAVIFSGTPVITVNPGTARVNQTYSYTVTDYNGNPLAEGTSIIVEVDGTAIKAAGHTSVLLDDTSFAGGINYENVVRGPGITEFTFRISEDVDPLNPEVPVVAIISIAVTGPNGSLEVVLGAGGEPYSRTDGVEMHRTSDGLFRFELSENPVERR